MLSIPWVRAESEVALVEPAEVVAGVGKVPSEVSTPGTVLSIAMHEKDYSFPLFGLARVSVVLKS